MAASVQIDLFPIYYNEKGLQHILGSCASIAQGLEHWSCKPGVVSSNLTGGCVCKFSVALNYHCHTHMQTLGGLPCLALHAAQDNWSLCGQHDAGWNSVWALHALPADYLS